LKIEITEQMERYRDACRSIWNQFIFDLPDKENWEFDDNLLQYSSIERKLFEIMVLNQVAPAMPYPIPQDTYYESVEGKIIFGPKGTKALWASRQKNTWNWQEILLPPETAIELRFIGFFDWGVENRKDNRYYRFRVLDCKEKEYLVGSDYLVEPVSVRSFYTTGT